MSYNYYHINGKVALLGWDRQKNRAVLMIGYAKPSMKAWLENIYLELNFVLPKVNDKHSFKDIMLSIKIAAESDAMNLPESIYKYLASDIRTDNTNSARIHHFDKIPTPIVKDPFSGGIFYNET
jgi:hypothetical protein